MRDRPSGLMPSELSPAALIDHALSHCAVKLTQPKAQVIQRLRSGDAEVHGTFRYALAKTIAGYLGTLGVPFRAVYVYGSAMGEVSSPCSDIDIILDLDHDSDRVQWLLRRLDIGLVTQFRALLPQARCLRSLLDVRVVTEHPCQATGRYMGGFSGLGTSPVCLWRVPPKPTGVLQPEGPRMSTVLSGRG